MSLRYRFVGLKTLPKLSDEDAQFHCALPPEHLEAILRQVPVASGSRGASANRAFGERLALAVHVLFLSLSGSHAGAKKTVPSTVLRLLCRQLSVPETHIATLQSLFDRPATLTAQRAWTRELLGFSQLDAEAEKRLAGVLALRAAEALSVQELQTVAERWLFDERIVISSERVVQDLARKAFAAVEELALKTVRGAMTPAALSEVVKVAFEPSPEDGMTVLEWLKSYEGKHGVKNLGLSVKKVKFLRDLRVDSWDVSVLSNDRIREFALRVQHRPPSDTKKLSAETKQVEIVCFYVYTLEQLTDEVIYRAQRHIADTERMGKGRVLGKRAALATTLVQGLGSMREVLQDRGKSHKQRCEELASMVDELLALDVGSQATIVRETLVEQQAKVGAVLEAYEALNISGDRRNKDTRLLEQLRELQGEKELPEGFDTSLVDATWRPLVESEDRKQGLAALKAHAACRIRDGLKGGRLHVDHSTDYRSRDDSLVAADVWDQRKEELCAAFGLKLDPEEALDALRQHVEGKLQLVEQALEQGLLEIEDGCVRIPKLTEDLEGKLFKELGQMQASIFEKIGPVQLPNVIMDVDVKSQFSKKLLGRLPRSKQELLAIWGALIAQGMGVTAKSVSVMVPGLSVSEIASAMKSLEVGTRRQAANASVVDFQQSFAIVKAWGTGSRGSADMMAMDATRHLSHARQNPRRQTMSTGLYTGKLDSYPIFYGEQLVQNTWQDGPAVQGVQEYNEKWRNGRARIETLAVDTHGFSYTAMAVAKFSGFDLCPQLARLPDRKLLIPRGWASPESLEDIARPVVTLSAIRDAWPEMMRFMVSCLLGKTTHAWVVARMGSAAKGDPVRRGFEEFGKLLRTLFLCDYFVIEDFRREIHTLLNRGENVHFLMRAINPSRMRPERGRRWDELSSIAGAHALLTNIVMAWNTMKLDGEWTARAAAGDRTDPELIRRTAPTHFENINMRGQFTFEGLDRVAEALVEPAVWQQRAKVAA